MDLEKLQNIQKKIQELKKKPVIGSKTNKVISPFTIAIDLVSGTMVGVVIGILLDKLVNSKPFFLVLCMVIDMIAGFNIIWQKLNK